MLIENGQNNFNPDPFLTVSYIMINSTEVCVLTIHVELEKNTIYLLIKGFHSYKLL